MSKLNDEYFKAKKIYKEDYKKRKITFRQRILNIIITALLLSIVHYFQKGCSRRIKENEKKSIIVNNKIEKYNSKTTKDTIVVVNDIIKRVTQDI